MSAILMDIRPVTALNENGDMVKFKPLGNLIEVGDASSFFSKDIRANPILDDSAAPTHGARIFVGFNVGIVAKWKLQDAMDIVFRVRLRQVKRAIKLGYATPHPAGGDIGATFLAQRGLWQPVKTRKAHPEDGAQVIIMNIIHEKKSEFQNDMVEIAEALARELEQQAVLLEFQVNGAVKRTLLIGP